MIIVLFRNYENMIKFSKSEYPNPSPDSRQPQAALSTGSKRSGIIMPWGLNYYCHHSQEKINRKVST